MHTIDTIAEFLTAGNSHWQAFDLGRVVQPLSAEQFTTFERGEAAYPYPIAGHAQLAVAFWHQSQPQQHYIWFLKFPLDEQGLLVFAARNDFLERVVQALGNQVDQAAPELDNHPYSFTPIPSKMALFHAMLAQRLCRPASRYYEDVERYFKQHDIAWQNLGLQGLADFVVRLSQFDNEQALLQQWPHLPAEMATPLCAMLESVQLSTASYQQWLSQFYAQPSPQLARLFARAPTELQQQVIGHCVKLPSLADDVMIVVSARLWPALCDYQALKTWLSHVAGLTGDAEQPFALFVGIFQDLVAIPTLRPHLLRLLRDSERSAALNQAIGVLFSS